MFASARLAIWKLASRVCVFADWDGFAEKALPGNGPGGLLAWVGDMVATLGLSDALWWASLCFPLALAVIAGVFAFPRTPRLLRGALALVPVVWTALAFHTLDAEIWFLRVPGFLVRNNLGWAAALGIAAALRPLVCRGAWGAPVAALVAFALYVPFGAFALLAGGMAFTGGFVRFRERTAFQRTALALAALSLAFVPRLACRFVWDDLALEFAVTSDFRCWRPRADASGILASERALVAEDFAAVARVAADDPGAHRVVLARRILAWHRLGLLPKALDRLPMMVYSGDVEDPESSVDGYLLYYNYGLVSQAQYWIEQNAAHYGEQPLFWLYLGRIALLSGEVELARRYFRRLSRCPFRDDDARRHLRWCTPEGLPAFMERNRDIAAMARVWFEQGGKGRLPTFFTPTENAEHFVYSCFDALDDEAPPPMLATRTAARALMGKGVSP